MFRRTLWIIALLCSPAHLAADDLRQLIDEAEITGGPVLTASKVRLATKDTFTIIYDDGETDNAYRESVAEAARSGCNVIDTAVNYRFQRSERSVGQAIDDLISSGDVRRDQLVVSTKGGRVAVGGSGVGSVCVGTTATGCSGGGTGVGGPPGVTVGNSGAGTTGATGASVATAAPVAKATTSSDAVSAGAAAWGAIIAALTGARSASPGFRPTASRRRPPAAGATAAR